MDFGERFRLARHAAHLHATLHDFEVFDRCLAVSQFLLEAAPSWLGDA